MNLGKFLRPLLKWVIKEAVVEITEKVTGKHHKEEPIKVPNPNYTDAAPHIDIAHSDIPSAHTDVPHNDVPQHTDIPHDDVPPPPTPVTKPTKGEMKWDFHYSDVTPKGKPGYMREFHSKDEAGFVVTLDAPLPENMRHKSTWTFTLPGVGWAKVVGRPGRPGYNCYTEHSDNSPNVNVCTSYAAYNGSFGLSCIIAFNSNCPAGTGPVHIKFELGGIVIEKSIPFTFVGNQPAKNKWPRATCPL